MYRICLLTELSVDFKQEAESSIIELEGNDLTTIHDVLQYLYGFDYSDEADLPQMTFNAQVYALADKYDILALKTLVTAKFKELAKAGWKPGIQLTSLIVLKSYTKPVLQVNKAFEMSFFS